MLMLNGMQTVGPLLISPLIITGCAIIPQKCVPIKLADHTIVFSAVVESVAFQPVIEGKSARAVELTQVLHVPDLKNNLLSVLYLTRHSGFVVNINSSTMVFSRPPGPPPFVATINDSNDAFLDGMSLPITQVARPASTLPLDLSLWHCRLAHHHLEGVRMLYKRDMVTGMKLEVRTSPDPVCEPCLAGKMHANPFPSSEWRASHPLELVHTDVHMLPYRTLSGHCYWVTLIDNYSRYCFVTPIAAKSDVFEAFKRFKAFGAGSFITPLPSAQSFLNMLTLMNAISWLLRGLSQCAWCAPLH